MPDLSYFQWNVNLDATSMTYNDARATSFGRNIAESAFYVDGTYTPMFSTAHYHAEAINISCQPEITPL